MIIGVVADDITGSNDIGIMFTNAGCLAHIYTYERPGDFRDRPKPASEPDVVILDTNSRLDPQEVAYRKVYAAAKELAEAGCPRYFNKTCSVFRGNIGPEFDAMLDALGEEFAVVVLGFPKNGRKTIDGIHYVHGKLLEESEFRNDPIHPMTRSSIVDILQSQTQRRVGLVSHKVIAEGPDAVRRALEGMQATCNYAIHDVIDQDSLKVIARATIDQKVFCGSSALAEELPPAWGFVPRSDLGVSLPARDNAGILVLSGSLMPQSYAQVEHLKSNGVRAFELDTNCLFEPERLDESIRALASRAVSLLNAGQDVLLHTPNTQEKVDAARRAGEARGFSRAETGRMISDALARTTAEIRAQANLSRLVVAGGETSAAVCEKLGIQGMAVWKEIQPGLPSCVSLTEPPVFLVLKSGSFGKPNFLEQAVAHLRSE